jgi:hypothetical protein
MANSVLLHLTIDHETIVAWASRRNARPATLEGDEQHSWPLFFDFGTLAPGLVDIGWDRFFAEFERADLAFVYRDTSPSGELDDFHAFVKRAAAPELTLSGKSTITEQAI